jgi:hypothetical protein
MLFLTCPIRASLGCWSCALLRFGGNQHETDRGFRRLGQEGADNAEGEACLGSLHRAAIPTHVARAEEGTTSFGSKKTQMLNAP